MASYQPLSETVDDLDNSQSDERIELHLDMVFQEQVEHGAPYHYPPPRGEAYTFDDQAPTCILSKLKTHTHAKRRPGQTRREFH